MPAEATSSGRDDRAPFMPRCAEGGSRRRPAAGRPVAQAADRQRRGAVLRESGDELLQQRLERVAVDGPEHRDQVAERDGAHRQNVGRGPAPLPRQVQRPDAMIGSGTPLDEPVAGEPVDDLHGRGVRDAQHAGQRFDRLAGIRVEVNERARMRPAPAQGAVHGRAEPIRGGERQHSQQLLEAVRHLPYT